VSLTPDDLAHPKTERAAELVDQLRRDGIALYDASRRLRQ
jgi:hypothetical protein